MRLLLINPRFPESFWSSKWALAEVLPNKRTMNPPLGLATLAALCPPHWEVEIVDENIEPIPLEPQVDIVGVCGMGVQFPRQQELLAYYRSRGHYVRRQLRVAVPGTIYHPRRHRRRRGIRIHLEGVLPRLRVRQPQTTIPRDRDGGPHRLPDAALRPPEARALQLRLAAVLARLPISLRVLRHHRHVRSQAAG